MGFQVIYDKELKRYPQQEIWDGEPNDPDSERLYEEERYIAEHEIIGRRVSDDFDYQYYFAWEYFKDAKYVTAKLVNKMDSGSDYIYIFHVTCTYPSQSERMEEAMYGNDYGDDY